MTDQARITSIHALEGFRSELIRYVETARTAHEHHTAGVPVATLAPRPGVAAQAASR